MDLVERYLAAIRRNLPADKADDIFAELADLLESRREEREDRLGRPLDKKETAALLKEFGHPLVIAARYKPQQYLIGPDVFPFYLFTLKIALAAGAAIMLASAAFSIMFGQQHVTRAVFQSMDGLWSMFFATIAVVTIVFAVLERYGFPAGHLANWRPDQLPDALDKPRTQWESAIGVGFGVAFILWWTGMFQLPEIVHHSGVRIVAGPVWADYYLPILVLASVQLGIDLIRWLRPRWKVTTGVLTIGVGVATLAMISGIYHAGHWVTTTAAGMDAGEAARIGESVELAFRIGLIAVAGVMAVQMLVELWRLVRPAARTV